VLARLQVSGGARHVIGRRGGGQQVGEGGRQALQFGFGLAGLDAVDHQRAEAADLLPGERVDICNCTNGNRLSTYVIPGERGGGEICVNGAAAHLVSPGDVVILIAYSQMSDAEARTYLPRVVFVDEANRIVERGTDPGQIPADSDVARLQGLRPTGIPLAEARA